MWNFLSAELYLMSLYSNKDYIELNCLTYKDKISQGTNDILPVVKVINLHFLIEILKTNEL